MSNTTSTPVVLTLGATSVLTTPQQIIDYQIAKYFSVPKSYSNTFKDMIVSLTDTVSLYAQIPSTLCTQVSSELTTLFQRLFPTATVTITVTTSSNADSTYNARVGISISINGTTYSVSPSIQVVNGQILILNDTVQTVKVNTLLANT